MNRDKSSGCERASTGGQPLMISGLTTGARDYLATKQ
jgi:hypothetical protein